MKSYLACILFFTLVLRPVCNIGYIAYFQLNLDYIIETYCINKEKPELQCHGKCHLATQLATNSQDTTGETSYLNTLFETFIPVYFETSLFDFNIVFQNNSKQKNWNYKDTFNIVFTDYLYRPPQV